MYVLFNFMQYQSLLSGLSCGFILVRSPALPPSCFHGACYLEKLDVLRENGRHTLGMRLHIFYEGFLTYTFFHRKKDTRLMVVTSVFIGFIG